MEILFPAGSMKHIDVAIRSGVNAVYGGFKQWNARDKADNFSFSQYKSVLDKLHRHGIKFYLTLNTLLFDDEITKIIDLFNQHPEYLPDAFIATDLGLVSQLNKHFVQIPIHLSTQFGVHNSDDMKFAKRLGATRVILSRELTKDTVKKICDNSTLETECFIYGSQCISFSGQCYFSSLLNGGSGNRGKCEIFCRDNYSTKCAKGNLLYVPDMNCTGIIKDLPQVVSWKLEGRKRNPEQVGTFVDKLKRNELIYPQTGYMYGTDIESNGLFNEKHIRAVPLLYISTYNISGNNISFNIKSENGFIQEITFIDNFGAGHKYIRPKHTMFINFDMNYFIDTIQQHTGMNVYKITGNESENKELFIDKNILENLIQHIPNKKERILNKKTKSSEIWLETDDADTVSILQQKYPNMSVIYNIASIANFEQAPQTGNKNTIYKLPMFNFDDVDLSKYYAALSGKRVMFTHIGQLATFAEIPLQERLTDYTIPVWNKLTLKYLKQYDINAFTASPELSFTQNSQILGDVKTNYIIYGKLPLVFTRMCFKHLFRCDKCINPELKTIKNIDKNLDFDIKCHKDYRIILAQQPIRNQFINGINRLVVNDMTLEEISNLIENYQSCYGYICNQNEKRR